MAPLCILKEEEQTIDIFSPSVVTVTPFWLLLKIVLTLSFLRHDGEKCLFWVTHMLVFWGFYWKKYKKTFCTRPLAKPFLHNGLKERHTTDPRQSHAKYPVYYTFQKYIFLLLTTYAYGFAQHYPKMENTFWTCLCCFNKWQCDFPWTAGVCVWFSITIFGHTCLSGRVWISF